MMILNPEISVIVSVDEPSGKALSKERIEQTLSSVLEQQFFDFELLIIGTPSLQHFQDIWEKYMAYDGRVKYVSCEDPTASSACSYNRGISCSQGRYLSFLCFSDILLPNALSDLYMPFFLNYKHSLGMSYGRVYNPSTPQKNDTKQTWDLRELAKHNYIPLQGSLVRRDVFDLVGGFDEDPAMKALFHWNFYQRLGNFYSAHTLSTCVAESIKKPPTDSSARVFFKPRLPLLLGNKKKTFRHKVRFVASRALIHLPLLHVCLNAIQRGYQQGKKVLKSSVKKILFPLRS